MRPNTSLVVVSISADTFHHMHRFQVFISVFSSRHMDNGPAFQFVSSAFLPVNFYPTIEQDRSLCSMFPNNRRTLNSTTTLCVCSLDPLEHGMGTGSCSFGIDGFTPKMYNLLTMPRYSYFTFIDSRQCLVKIWNEGSPDDFIAPPNLSGLFLHCLPLWW